MLFWCFIELSYCIFKGISYLHALHLQASRVTPRSEELCRDRDWHMPTWSTRLDSTNQNIFSCKMNEMKLKWNWLCFLSSTEWFKRSTQNFDALLQNFTRYSMKEMGPCLQNTEHLRPLRCGIHFISTESSCVISIDPLGQSMRNLSDLPFVKQWWGHSNGKKWMCWRNSYLLFVLSVIGLMFMAKWHYHQHPFGQRCTWPSPFLTFRASWRAMQTWICHIAHRLPSLPLWPHGQCRPVSFQPSQPSQCCWGADIPRSHATITGDKASCRRASFSSSFQAISNHFKPFCVHLPWPASLVFCFRITDRCFLAMPFTGVTMHSSIHKSQQTLIRTCGRVSALWSYASKLIEKGEDQETKIKNGIILFYLLQYVLFDNVETCFVKKYKSASITRLDEATCFQPHGQQIETVHWRALILSGFQSQMKIIVSCFSCFSYFNTLFGLPNLFIRIIWIVRIAWLANVSLFMLMCWSLAKRARGILMDKRWSH